jgi:hypothetical protein
MTDYITSANFKTRHGITTSGNDARITAHITAASLEADAYCGRQFGPGTPATTRYFSAYADQAVLVDDCYTITSVDLDLDDDGTYETNVPSTDYITLPLNGIGSNRQSGWPVTELRLVSRTGYFPRCTRPGVKVSATFGWAAVPTDVVEATYLMAHRLYYEVAVPSGMTPGNIDFGLPGSPLARPYTVERLLNPYRRADRVIGVA